MMLHTTILAPVGVEYIYDKIRPNHKQIIDTKAELRVTVKNLFAKRIAVNGGKTIKLVISNAPIKRIPTTITNAVKNAITILKPSVLVPVALAKFSSKVTAKILL